MLVLELIAESIVGLLIMFNIIVFIGVTFINRSLVASLISLCTLILLIDLLDSLKPWVAA